MKKSYKIEVDCAACALKMEEAAKKNRRCSRCYSCIYDTEDECGI